MRRRALRHLLAALLTWPALALCAHAAPGLSYGEHGMVLFGGKEALYASHLPMFHAPHDYQVILQIHLAEPTLDAQLRQRLDGKHALWTIAPEQFELDRLAPHAPAPLQQFSADLVLGHFEQGGRIEYAGALVVIDKVLLFRQLAPQASDSDNARYLQLGNARQRYLVKQIDSRPDFAHIVAISTRADAPSGAVIVRKHALAEPTARQLAQAMGSADVHVVGTIYFSTEDLK